MTMPGNQDLKAGLLISQTDKEVKAMTELEKEDEAEIVETTMEATNSGKEVTAEIGITVEEEKEMIIVETDTTEKEVTKSVMKTCFRYSCLTMRIWSRAVCNKVSSWN